MSIEDKVNEVLTYHLSVLYDTEAIKMEFGEDVFQVIDEITSYAANDVVWAGNDDEFNHTETCGRLSVDYPFLTKASRIKIADIAAYFWKANGQ